jgi:hypothetical protein
MKTHQIHSNIASMWLAESPGEACDQIAVIVGSLGDGTYEHCSINRVPPETEYDEFPDTDEWIQSGGSSQRLTVEVKKLDADGVFRLYVVGHAAAADEQEESELIEFGGNDYWVLPAEVLNSTEAIHLFQNYYYHNSIPDGWHLRQRAEYSEAVG